MAYFAFYRDEIDKTMIAFEFSLIELLSILNFTILGSYENDQFE